VVGRERGREGMGGRGGGWEVEGGNVEGDRGREARKREEDQRSVREGGEGKTKGARMGWCMF